MSKRAKKKQMSKVRAEPQKRSAVWAMVGSDDYDSLCVSGYTSLMHCPEVATAIDCIARLISSMTIHLMANTERGDIRIKNELSKKVDIYPNEYMTRSNWMHCIIKTMLGEGNGNAVVYPETKSGLLNNLIPIPAGQCSFISDGSWGYRILINGKMYNPADVLHFVANPSTSRPWLGEGYRVSLKEVANNLKQAAATERGFMSSKWKPSIIIKVDGLIDEFSSPEGRKKLLDDYVSTENAGEPWIIPSEQFSVEQVRPLSLADLAISDVVQLDRRAVASILGVPAFVLGVGEFDKTQWNSFISTTIMPIAKNIEQELTRKLLISEKMYFRFNSRSLYTYDMTELANVADAQYIRGIMTGNEVRDWLSLSPMEGLDELVILENYIPLGTIGDQKKLLQGET